MIKKILLLCGFILIVFQANCSSRIDSIQRDGSFSSQNYIWNYHILISSNSVTPENLTLSLNIPSGFPFIVSGLPTTFSISSSNPIWINFNVTVPLTYISDPVNVDSYYPTLELKRGLILDDFRTVRMRGPLLEHPRLLVRASEIPMIANRVNHPDLIGHKNYFITKLNSTDSPISPDNTPFKNIAAKIEAQAFHYLIDKSTNSASGIASVQNALQYMNSISIVDVNNYSKNQWCYESVFSMACVYDWCYELISPSDREIFITEMKRICNLGEYSFPNTTQRCLSGHYGEYAPVAFLAAGIAVFDEDPDFFDFEYDEQINGFAPSRNQMYKAERHHQGTHYYALRFVNETRAAFMLSKLGLNPYSADMFKVPNQLIWSELPNDLVIREGDDQIPLDWSCYSTFSICANLSGDPVIQYAAKRKLVSELYTFELPTKMFIFHNPLLPETVTESQSTAHYYPSPAGTITARTKWDLGNNNSDVVLANMNIREFVANNHAHLDHGHFDIYYKGILTGATGNYQADANSNYGTLHHKNYFQRSISHNTILVEDPLEPKNRNTLVVKDGGAFFFSINEFKTSSEMQNAGQGGKVMNFEIEAQSQPEYSYLKGDITNAYNFPDIINASYPNKVDTIRRSFVFLNLNNNSIPASLIVFDKVVSTNPTFKKKWLLHSQFQPTLSSNSIEITRTDGTNNGKLINTILIPESSNRTIDFIGGANNEFLVQTVNFPSLIKSESGQWRTEISPVNPSRSDNFLNVMQVMDANSATIQHATNKAYSSIGNYISVEIADRLIIFNEGLENTAEDIQISMGNVSTNYKVLVTDLKEGNWCISSPDGQITLYAGDEDGTVYFNSKGGLFNFKYLPTCEPLSINLMKFYLKEEDKGGNKKVRLFWETSGSGETSNIQIERSDDGLNFITIGNVSQQNVTSLFLGSYLDNDIQTEVTSYYRLKIINHDDFYYSKIIKTDWKKTSTPIVFPNPFFDELNVKGIDYPYSLKLYDLYGKECFRKKDIENMKDLDFTFINPGVYMIELENENIKYNQLIIKK